MWICGSRRGLLATTGLTFGLLWACNPFATREPEPPEGAPIEYLPRNLAENILENLKMSCEHHRADDYMSWLTEDFRFEPDPSDVLAYEDKFLEPWDHTRERQFVDNWLDKRNTPSIEFEQWELMLQETVEEGEHFEYAYTFKLKHSRDAPEHVEGKGHFYLKADEQGQWAIFRWVDEKIGVHLSSWGELRARF